MIGISDGDNSLDGYQSPIDRITENPIKLGTAYHDISKTCIIMIYMISKKRFFQTNAKECRS